MQLMVVSVKEKKTGDSWIFDVHAEDGEQAIELVWHIIDDELGGKMSEYNFRVTEILLKPMVVSYGENSDD